MMSEHHDHFGVPPTTHDALALQTFKKIQILTNSFSWRGLQVPGIHKGRHEVLKVCVNVLLIKDRSHMDR